MVSGGGDVNVAVILGGGVATIFVGVLPSSLAAYIV